VRALARAGVSIDFADAEQMVRYATQRPLQPLSAKPWQTPLLVCAFMGCAKPVRPLVEAGADLRRTNKAGQVVCARGARR
jgi:hypothetical protein